MNPTEELTIPAPGLAAPTDYLPAQHLWPSTPRGVHRARHALTATLTQWGIPELTDQAGLVLSELMTNAHKHGFVATRSIGTSFIQLDAAVRLEVHDTRPDAHPTLLKATDSDETGRGLAIVDAITNHQWGVTLRQGPGKVVWAIVTGAMPVRNGRSG
jgi:anti-sigma regulatory factor (Ser/Thr protein kinase)